MKYVVDPNNFNGSAVTSMSDDIHSDYGGETLEELKEREKNPDLICITQIEHHKMLGDYLKKLASQPFEEISKERYYEMFECLPPERTGYNWFFVGEPYTYDLFHFCFTIDDRYFCGLRRISTPKDELIDQINYHSRKLRTHES